MIVANDDHRWKRTFSKGEKKQLMTASVQEIIKLIRKSEWTNKWKNGVKEARQNQRTKKRFNETQG